jgi:hypothetical protein
MTRKTFDIQQPTGEVERHIDRANGAPAVEAAMVSRPLEGEAPTIDVAVGYSKSNTSPILKLFLSRLDELVGPNQKR